MNRSGVIRSAVVVSFAALLAGIVNYATLVILAARFGARFEMDAFFSALTIPQIFSAVLLATLSTTFIPVFIEEKHKNEANAWKTASIAANLIFLALLGLAMVGALFSEPIISLINPGFTAETTRLSASLFCWLLAAAVFSGSSILLSSLHYSLHRFFKPVSAQLLNAVIVLLFVLAAGPKIGIQSVAVGTFIGSFVQFCWLAPILLRPGRYQPAVDIKHKAVGKLARLMLPLFIGAVFYKTYPLVERFLASSLGEGSISYLGYSNKIITALLMVISQGLSTVLFPKMSEFSAVKDFRKLSETMTRAFKVLMALSFPAAAYLVLFRYDMIRFLFERGSFGPGATAATGDVLAVSLGFFLAAALSTPLVNALYALQETFKVAVVGISGFALYLLLAVLLSRELSYLGIALAASIQYPISVAILIVILAKKIGFEKKRLLVDTGKIMLISVLCFLAVHPFKTWIGAFLQHPLNFFLSSAVFFLLALAFMIGLKVFRKI